MAIQKQEDLLNIKLIKYKKEYKMSNTFKNVNKPTNKSNSVSTYPDSVNLRTAQYHTKEEREMFQLQARCKGLENWKSKT